MVRDVAFGQYFPGNSLMHKLDPRAKLLCFVAFIVIALEHKNPLGTFVRSCQTCEDRDKHRWHFADR